MTTSIPRTARGGHHHRPRSRRRHPCRLPGCVRCRAQGRSLTIDPRRSGIASPHRGGLAGADTRHPGVVGRVDGHRDRPASHLVAVLAGRSAGWHPRVHQAQRRVHRQHRLDRGRRGHVRRDPAARDGWSVAWNAWCRRIPSRWAMSMPASRSASRRPHPCGLPPVARIAMRGPRRCWMRWTGSEAIACGSSLKFCRIAEGELDLYPAFRADQRMGHRRRPGDSRSSRRRGAGSARQALPLQPARHVAQWRFHRIRRLRVAGPVAGMSDQRDIDSLLAIMAALRDPATGCPWDVAADLRQHRAVHHRGSLRSRRCDRSGRHGWSQGRIGRPAVAGGVPFADGAGAGQRSSLPMWSPLSATR